MRDFPRHTSKKKLFVRDDEGHSGSNNAVAKIVVGVTTRIVDGIGLNRKSSQVQIVADDNSCDELDSCIDSSRNQQSSPTSAQFSPQKSSDAKYVPHQSQLVPSRSFGSDSQPSLTVSSSDGDEFTHQELPAYENDASEIIECQTNAIDVSPRSKSSHGESAHNSFSPDKNGKFKWNGIGLDGDAVSLCVSAASTIRRSSLSVADGRLSPVLSAPKTIFCDNFESASVLKNRNQIDQKHSITKYSCSDVIPVGSFKQIEQTDLGIVLSTEIIESQNRLRALETKRQAIEKEIQRVNQQKAIISGRKNKKSSSVSIINKYDNVPQTDITCSQKTVIQELDKIVPFRGAVANLKHHKSTTLALMKEVQSLSYEFSSYDESDADSSLLKETCILIAKRLEEMELKLLELAGESKKGDFQPETAQIDALKALARAASHQAKKASSLEKQVNAHKKTIEILNELCQRLLEGKQQDQILLSQFQDEVAVLQNSKLGLLLELQKNIARIDHLTKCNHDLSSDIQGLNEKILKMESDATDKENTIHELETLLLGKTSECEEIQGDLDKRVGRVFELEMELAKSHVSKSSLNHAKEKFQLDRVQSELAQLRQENKRRADADKAIIDKLRSEMEAMSASHIYSEKLSENKIQMLKEMNCTLEEKVISLESR